VGRYRKGKKGTRQNAPCHSLSLFGCIFVDRSFQIVVQLFVSAQFATYPCYEPHHWPSPPVIQRLHANRPSEWIDRARRYGDLFQRHVNGRAAAAFVAVARPARASSHEKNFFRLTPFSAQENSARRRGPLTFPVGVPITATTGETAELLRWRTCAKSPVGKDQNVIHRPRRKRSRRLR